MDVNSVNKNKTSPLHAACWYNELETIKLLVKEGANLNALDSKGVTPLFNIPKYHPFLPHLKFFLITLILTVLILREVTF